MTIRYVGPGGNDGNSGLTWVLRKLTLNGCEDTPVAAGDIVHVAAGVYRETLDCDVSGANLYSAGTVTVTSGSTTVTGAGTAFLANILVADMFHVAIFASAADGVANGTATFTSAAGNFQASMVGKVIQINTRGAYVVGVVGAANTITLIDVNGLGWPGAAVGLTYSVMSGEGHYEIASVTDNTNFELTRPWCAPTLTGLAYVTFTPIRYLADQTGENTDGVGGTVRITGSNNDAAIVRPACIVGSGRSYRLFRGFQLDLCSTYAFLITTSSNHWVVEDCSFVNIPQFGLLVTGGSLNSTIRRCVFLGNLGPLIGYWRDAVTIDDCGHVCENCLFDGGMFYQIQVIRCGGVTIKDCSFLWGPAAITVTVAPAVGQTVVVNNSIIDTCTSGFVATAVGQITENYNVVNSLGLYWVNTAAGAQTIFAPSLIETPRLVRGFRMPWWFGELSEWSLLGQRVGFQQACHDLHGFSRPVYGKKSMGALQHTDMERDVGTVYAGAASMEISDAGRIQFKVPIAAESTTVEIYVQREANYAGVNPQLVIKQPGQADQTTTDAGAASAWNLLTDTFTPAALPPYMIVELVSNNTAVAANIATYWDNLRVG